MTLLEWRLLNKIDKDEFFQNGWSKEDTASTTSPNILEMIEHSNRVSHWVATLVLAQQDIDGRTSVIENLVEIADECRKLQNFQTTISIVCGLERWMVSRLKRNVTIFISLC